jgi:hypothetical protein
LMKFAAFSDDQFHILIHWFGKEWNKRTHQNINVEEDIEQDVQWDFPV